MLIAESANVGQETTGDLRKLGVATIPQVEPAPERTIFDDIFRASIEAGMTKILGAGGAKATLYHLNLSSLESPNRFHDKLTAIFGVGAPSLERVILQQLNLALGVGPASSKDDFVSQVERARTSFDAMAKRTRMT